ncbi:heavy metal translocating P-type ATPase (plasmid) [Haloferacaceae archaeon DSL9]
MTTCDLCDLPIDGGPVSAADVDGEFCCRGCCEVSRVLGNNDDLDIDVEDIREGPPDLDRSDLDGETAYLSVKGMHCTTCETFIGALARQHEGIYDAQASYATDMVRVTYDPERLDRDDLPDLLSEFGYRASEPGTEDASFLDQFEFGRYRSVVAIAAMMPVMAPYILFIYPTYLGIYSREFLYGSTINMMVYVPLMVWTTLLLLGLGYPIFRGAYVSLRVRQPNMDVLIALAVLAAYLYSVVTLFVFDARDVYFDVAVMVLVVVTVGNHIEDKVKQQALGNHSDLTESRIRDARVLGADGSTAVIPLEECRPGDRVLVKPGERIPVDGVVADGTAAVDEALVTGESIPQSKAEGDEVIGGSVVTDSALVIEVGEEVSSTLDRLVELLWNIQSADTGIQRLVNRFAVVFVPFIAIVAIATAIFWIAMGRPVSAAVLIGVSVLVISCPCSIGIATPLALASGSREASDNQTLILNSTILETINDTDIVAFDKTGTLTTGTMSVEGVFGDDPDEVLRRAAAVEARSSHPIAEAITAEAGPHSADVTAFDRRPRSVSAVVDGTRVTVGHPAVFDAEGWDVPTTITDAMRSAIESDTHPTVVGWDGEARGVITIRDTPRENWDRVVSDLAAAGRRIVVITGDDERMAQRFAEHPNIDNVFAEVPPEAKEAIIQRLRREGRTTMIGDGTNDAPALASADLGIAMANGTEITMDAADAVVMNDDLSSIPKIFEIARATRGRIKQNMWWAVGYNLVAVPLAIAGLINPLIAAVAMAISSLIVVGNSGRSLLRRS